MNGIDFIADTNALLYIFKKNLCMIPYLDKTIGISVISEMELLSFPKITITEEMFFKRMIAKCFYFPLDENVKNRAILIRRAYSVKLPDAIVAATAVENNIPLITADKGFEKIKELDLRLLNPSI